MIYNNYEILFTRNSSAGSTTVVMDKIPEELNWIAMIDRLSNGDITKHSIIYQTNYIECLNLMAWWAHKDKQIQQINRMNERKINSRI